MNSKTSDKIKQKHQNTRKLIPVPEWNNHHDWPPIGGLRHLIFNKATNGFETAFKKIGRRVLIDEDEFFRCVDRVSGGES